ncbi:MAG TPA: beta-galactosidase [Phycisphaerae bacterium]|nr:beta-galactosidase [Phycisphaerae bacterium]
MAAQRWMRWLAGAGVMAGAVVALGAGGNSATQAGAARGMPVFPIGVWLQSPANAEKYKALGINVYVGLWQGPTAEQLEASQKAGMPVICEQNAEGLKPRWKEEIVGWMQGDEPDNAQASAGGKGYGPPITPAEVETEYRRMKEADPSRPVLLNLGQGVAWDGWYGRGVRTNKPEDYPEYVKGGDIVSFDIYPVVSTDAAVTGKLELVGKGVERLVEWTGHQKPVWACLECTHISNAERKPTPEQVETEAWLAITHGATGLVYFAHQFKPRFVEAGLLEDKEMCAAVERINARIERCGEVLVRGEAAAVSVETAGPDGKRVGEAAEGISALAKKMGPDVYVFAVNGGGEEMRATFRVGGVGPATKLSDMDGRAVEMKDGAWADDFKAGDVHVYRVAQAARP